MNIFIAVDGGADHLFDAGVMPAAVIGDLDSISQHARDRFAQCTYHISEQDTTDFEKTLSRVNAPLVIALGFTGGRLDHMLAVLNVLARYADRAIVLVDETDVSFVAKQGQTQLQLPIGTRIALMPLSDVQATATGVRWPLTNAAMHPAGMISSSNEVAAETVTIDAAGPLLVTVPRAYLDCVLTAAVRG